MIKLYVFYFIFGLYMLFNSYTIWFFSAMFSDFKGGGVSVITYIAFFSSMILFSVCPGLSLYRIKLALLTGLVSLITIFPFGIHWLIYRIQNEAPITKGAFNQIVLLATLVYAIGLLYSIFLLVNNKRQLNTLKLNKRWRICITMLPVFLLVVFVVLGYVNP